MRRPLLALASSLLVLPLLDAGRAPRDDAARVLVHVGDAPITLGEYKDFLYDAFGHGPLREMIRLRRLQAEAARLGVTPTDAELDAAVQELWDQLLTVRHGGDEAAFLAELNEQGFDAASFRAFQRMQQLQEQLPPRIVRATRAPDAEDLRVRFDRDYGVDGVRVVVRHLLLNAAATKAEMMHAGADPASLTDEVVAAEQLRRAEALLAELRAGVDFEALARRDSHDRSVQQNGGVIPGYNYERYGDELAAAVRAAEVGAPGGPVVAQNRVHLFVVESRVVTAFADVEAEVFQRVMDDPPSWDELRQLDERVNASSPVRFP